MGYFPGSTVLMADGSRKPVEQIQYGDYVKDFQGNSKMVDAVRATHLYNYKNRKREWWLINNSFLITDTMSFFTPDYKIRTVGSQETFNEAVFDKKIIRPVVTKNNAISFVWYWFDDSYSTIFAPMQVGDVLLKENNQTETVTSLENVSEQHASDNNVTYAFGIEGGGTAWVDGYLTIARMGYKFDFSTMEYCPDAVITVGKIGSVDPELMRSNNPLQRIKNPDLSSITDFVWNEKYEIWE